VARYDTIEEMVADLAEALRPPERLDVPAAAERYRQINNPGSYVGPLRMDRTPYLVEPLRVLTSLNYNAMIFCGPAQAAKTEGFLSWLAYSVVSDPGDIMIVHPSQTVARDFYMRRLEKFYRDTPEVKRRILPGRNSQTVYSTKFSTGVLMTQSWPTINELSGKPVGRIWLSDYDRMTDDVGGEGSPFDLASKRTRTFRRRGMIVAESSPGRLVNREEADRAPETPHSAPVTRGGVLPLYNRGDRRRWYWPCVSCGRPFEPDFSLMKWPEHQDIGASAEQCWLECPHCEARYYELMDEETGRPGRNAMNRRGFWLADGQSVDPETGEIVGDVPRTRVASFWLKGPAAAFSSWSEMVLSYLQGLREYDQNGSEEALKTTINTDQGLPYTPQSSGAERHPEDIMARAKDYGERVVPPGVRFLVATVDVQIRRFEVQVHGVGLNGDIWIVDRFRIRKSERVDEDGDPLPLSPGGYSEDWDILVDKIIEAKYPLGDNSGRYMAIRMTAIDSGGSEGVTFNAYAFWRRLRDRSSGASSRVLLVKGEPSPRAPLVKLDYPDSEDRRRKARSRGDVPVLFIQSNKVKDIAGNMLAREDEGGRVNFPNWLPRWWYSELTAEVRTPSGWDKKRQNEAWDLLCYAIAILHSRRINLPIMDPENPPAWAAEWDSNPFVSGNPDDSVDNSKPRGKSLTDLASELG